MEQMGSVCGYFIAGYEYHPLAVQCREFLIGCTRVMIGNHEKTVAESGV